MASSAISNDNIVLVGEENPPPPSSLTFLEKKLDLLSSIQEYVELYNVQLDHDNKEEEDKEYDQDNAALDLSYNNDDSYYWHECH